MQAEELESPETIGIYNLMTKIGGDIGEESSWQMGFAWSHNKNGRGMEHDEHDEEPGHDDEHEDEHGHSHTVSYLGENTLITDFVYKWAPNGNYK